MAPDNQYEIKETSMYTFEVFDKDPTGQRHRQWIGSFRSFKDAIDFTRSKQGADAVSSPGESNG